MKKYRVKQHHNTAGKVLFYTAEKRIIPFLPLWSKLLYLYIPEIEDMPAYWSEYFPSYDSAIYAINEDKLNIKHISGLEIYSE